VSSMLDTLFEALSVISEGSHIYLCDLKKDYSRWSKNAVQYFGLPGEYMYNAGAIWMDNLHPDDREKYARSIDEIFSGTADSHNMMYRARTRDGSYVVCSCKGIVIKDDNGTPIFFGGTIRNHTVLSYTVGITGLRSLYGLMEDIGVMKSREMSYTLLMIGMNHFSSINDNYGFSFGNDTLSSFGKLLELRLGHLGQLYKLEGTKYALLSWGHSAEDISEIYADIKEEVAHGFYVDDEKIILSVNGSLVYVDDFNLSRDTILSCLKYTYYQSKKLKNGELEIFKDKLNNDGRRYIEMLNIIRNSVVTDCSGFFLCYQPIIDAGSEKVRGMEALIRWSNQEFGVVPPGKFIPIIEQDPIFPELGKWILRKAIYDGKRFVAIYPDFLVHVNISYAQLQRREFIPELEEVLRETGFPPQNLCIELTERCRLLDMGLLKKIFKSLRQLGVKIALDDFGTGFSSIGIIRELEFDSIKVDREFVKNIDVSTTDQKTVHFISNLADTFQAEVCVEGVENDRIRRVLGNYEVKSFQGNYYSEPITLEEFTKKYLPDDN